MAPLRMLVVTREWPYSGQYNILKCGALVVHFSNTGRKKHKNIAKTGEREAVVDHELEARISKGNVSQRRLNPEFSNILRLCLLSIHDQIYVFC